MVKKIGCLSVERTRINAPKIDESQSGEDKISHQSGYSCVLLGFSIGGPTDGLHSFVKRSETGQGLEMISADQKLEVKMDLNAILVETQL